MTLSEISRASLLPKSTVHRLLGRLIELGLVERHRSGYMVGLDLMNLAATNTAIGMREIALPYLAALHRWSGRSIQLTVMRGTNVVYLESIPASDELDAEHQPGQRIPAHCTAAGKAILAWEFTAEGLTPNLPSPLPTLTSHSISRLPSLMDELPNIRRQGFATEREEERIGLAHVAAPILQYNFAVGAVSMTWRTDEDIENRLIGALQSTATRIGRACRDALVRTGRPDWFIKER